MKMIVAPDMQEIQFCKEEMKKKQFCSKSMELRIRFPNDYTEIKQERVLLNYTLCRL